MQTLTEATRRYMLPPQGDGKDQVDIASANSKSRSLYYYTMEFWRENAFYDENRGMPSHATTAWISQFPEKKKLVSKGTLKFEFPNTDLVVERINAAFEPRFQDDLAEVMFKNMLARGAVADKVAERYALFKNESKVPDHNFDMTETFPLKDHQVVGLVNACALPGYGLLMDMGTGKTAIVITQICNLARTVEGPFRVLIVAPKNVRMNWEMEFPKFATLPGKVVVLRGTKIQRVRQLIDLFRNTADDVEYEVAICSYESLSRSWSALGESLKQLGLKWHLGVLDESHYIKSHRTKRAEYAHKLRDICENRVILSGSAITNTGLDLWTQLEYLYRGGSGMYSWNAFKRFYGRYVPQDNGQMRLDGMQNIPFMQERLARYTFHVRSEEVQKYLPERSFDAVEVSMTEEQREQYKTLRDSLAIEIEQDLAKGADRQELVVQNTLVKLLKLSQITSGFIKFSDEVDENTGEVLNKGLVYRFPTNPKLDELMRLLREKGPNDKTIVWACWVDNILQISERCKLAGIGHVIFHGSVNDKDREEAKLRYNEDPDCKVFIGNPGCGGEGVNLLGYPIPGQSELYNNGRSADDFTTNTTHKIHYSQDWSPTKRTQADKRGHREGTREPVRITDLCVPNTIDVQIRDRVVEKVANAMEISDLRVILQNVLESDLSDD